MQVDQSNQPFRSYLLTFIAPEDPLGASWSSNFRLRGLRQSAQNHDMMSSFTLSKTWQMRGLFLLESGRTKEGVEQLQAASRMNQAVLGEHYNYALILKKFGLLKPAAAELTLFLQGYNHVLPAHYQLGLLYTQTGRTEEALRVWRHLYSKNSGFADTALRLGQLLVQRKEWQPAIEPLNLALQKQPTALVYNLLGVAYEQTSQTQKAIVSYQRALKLEPEDMGVNYNYSQLLTRIKHPQAQAAQAAYQRIKKEQQMRKEP